MLPICQSFSPCVDIGSGEKPPREKSRGNRRSFLEKNYGVQYIFLSLPRDYINLLRVYVSDSLPYYENILGLKCYAVEEVADQKVKTAFFKVGNTKIELLEPTSEESTIAKFIEKRGEGIHHIAFAVADGVANALAEVAEKGVRLIDQAPRRGAEGLNIAFLHPKSTCSVLTELCEKPEK